MGAGAEVNLNYLDLTLNNLKLFGGWLQGFCLFVCCFLVDVPTFFFNKETNLTGLVTSM